MEARVGVMVDHRRFWRHHLRGGRGDDGGRQYRGRTRVLTTAIVLSTRQGDFNLAMALGLMLLGITFLVNVAMLRCRANRSMSRCRMNTHLPAGTGHQNL
jgi:hypothetical protein